MAAGPITLIIKDSKGYERQVLFWSSDGNLGGYLMPLQHLDPDQLAAVTSALAPLSTAAKQDTIIAGLTSIDGHVDGLEGTAASILAKLSSDPATDTKLEAVRALLAGTLTARPSTDQDPIYDHANGEKATVTTSAVVFTPPAGCKFARFDATVDTFIRTDDQPAADDGDAIRLIAGQPEILPVTATVAVRAYAASSSTLRITPMKVR